MRPVAGLLALTACTFFTTGGETGIVAAPGHTVATVGLDRSDFQRADIIDDIVEIIEKIVNPQPEDEEEGTTGP